MILVDTSVWVNHMRRGDPELTRLLLAEEAGLHPWVIGELAAGNLSRRAQILADLACLSQAPLAREEEVHHLLESTRLWGSGLGWIDLHLLASALLTGWRLYSADRALHEAAARLEIAHGRE